MQSLKTFDNQKVIEVDSVKEAFITKKLQNNEK